MTPVPPLALPMCIGCLENDIRMGTRAQTVYCGLSCQRGVVAQPKEEIAHHRAYEVFRRVVALWGLTHGSGVVITSNGSNQIRWCVVNVGEGPPRFQGILLVTSVEGFLRTSETMPIEQCHLPD